MRESSSLIGIIRITFTLSDIQNKLKMSNRHTEKRARSDFDSDSDEDEVEFVPNAKRVRILRRFLQDGNEAARLDQWDLILEGRVETVTIEALFEACRKNRLDVVKMILEHYKVDINGTDRAGNGLLHVMSVVRNSECVLYLLDHGADTTLTNTRGATPLYIACQNGYTEYASLILSKSIETINTPRNDGATPLHIACQEGYTECVRLLLDHGAVTSLRTSNGATPLFMACQDGYTECVRLLLEHDADTALTDTKGITSLFLACQYGYTDCVRLLLDHGADTTLSNSNGVTPLYMACQAGYTECASLILSKSMETINIPGNNGAIPLHVACQNGHTDCIRLLLEHGVVASLKTSTGATPLYIACQNGHTECASLILSKSMETINTPRNDGMTPLYIACHNGHINCVRLLLEHGADTNNVQCTNFAMENKHWDIVSLLLTHGAPVEKQYALLRPQRLRTHEDMCTVCLDPDKELVSFLPCGHSCCCRDCLIPMVRNGIKCPLCRTTVTDTLFLPS